MVLLHDLHPARDVTESVDGGKVRQHWPVAFVGFGIGVVTAACCDDSIFFPTSLDLLGMITLNSPAWSRSLAMQTRPQVPSTDLKLWRGFPPIYSST